MSDAGGTVGRDQVVIPLPPRRKVGVVLDDLGGTITTLKPSTARTLRLIRAYAADDSQVDLLWEIAGTLLPDLTADELEQLTAETVVRVMELANQPIAELEAIAKNAVAPLAKAPEKGSSSPTPSPTRSRGSRKGTASGSTT